MIPTRSSAGARTAERRRRARLAGVAAAVVLAGIATTALIANRGGRTDIVVGAATSTTANHPKGAMQTGEVTFDPPKAAAGSTVTLTVTASDNHVNEEFSIWIAYPNLGKSEIGSGIVDREGRMVTEVYIPNVLEHEYPIKPGSYDILIMPKNSPPEGAPTAKLDVVRAEVGRPYLYEQAYDCFDYLQFDTRLWLALTTSPDSAGTRPSSGRAWARGTLTLADDNHALFVTDSGTRVQYRSATPAERREFTYQCPNSYFDLKKSAGPRPGLP
jgi:hypothetical protein